MLDWKEVVLREEALRRAMLASDVRTVYTDSVVWER